MCNWFYGAYSNRTLLCSPEVNGIGLRFLRGKNARQPLEAEQHDLLQPHKTDWGFR